MNTDREKRLAGAVLFLLAWGAVSLALESGTGEEVREIRMTAKKYEFAPAEIRVKPGERVRLLVTATDRKHGFEIKELGVKATLEKDQETPVEFVAGPVGTYEFKCSVRCGWGHRRMKGRLIVEPATPKP